MARSNPQPEGVDVDARITAQIVAVIEAGAGEYRMPWHGGDPSVTRPINVVSGKAYRGVNRLALWIAAQSACYPSGLWGTYRHWQALGAQVCKGQCATTVIFWKEVGPARSEDDREDEPERRRFLARGYCVFNQAQVDNYEAKAPALLPEAERIAHAGAFYTRLSISTGHGGSETYFLPSRDRIHTPAFEAFQDPRFGRAWLGRDRAARSPNAPILPTLSLRTATLSHRRQ